YRQRFAHYGHGTEQQALIGLGGQAYLARNSQDAIREFRPYFNEAPVYGHGPSMEDFMDLTPLSVGSPQQVIDKTLTFREHFGDYQRQLFLVDHAGLPLKTVLDQLDLLGEEVVPVLRSQPALSRLVERLAERGLVERHADPADGRGVRLSLTAAGRTTQRAIGRRHARSVTQAMTAGLTRAEMAQLEMICRKLACAS